MEVFQGPFDPNHYHTPFHRSHRKYIWERKLLSLQLKSTQLSKYFRLHVVMHSNP